MFKRLLISAVLIGAVGTIATLGATGAFFNDTETSTGNTFAAGDIDLQIDNTSYVTNADGVLVASPANTWTLANLTNQLFFSFADVKPGDIGEDTISVHAGSNTAYACMAAKITATPDNGITDPESDATDVTDGANGGELQNFLNFAFWNDDGDNVYEAGEGQITQLVGPASGIFNGTWAPIADSANGVAIPAGTTRYIGKAWCFGTLTPNAATQDGLGTTNPLTRQTTGFTCDGSGNNNIAQTDGVNIDVSFYAVQTRNNAQFLCSSLAPLAGARPLVGAANFAAGTPTCDITADDNGAASAGHTNGVNAIATAITQATTGQTICVAAGTYNEFTVDKSVTIRGLTNPEGGTPAVVNPSSASVTDLALIEANNVTVTGLKFDGNGTVTAGQAAGVRISPIAASLSGDTVSYNVITNISAATGFSAKGIQWFTDTNSGFTLSNSSFAHNTISNIHSVNKGGFGVQTVGSMSNVAINNNTISNTTGAWGAGVAVDTKNTTLTSVAGSSITLNQIMTGVSDGITRFSVQVENGINATGVGIHQNNIETSLHGGGNVALGTEGTLNAQSNWWGTAAPVIGTDVFNFPITNVTDFTLPEASIFVQN